MIYFSIRRCNYGSLFKCNDVRSRFSVLQYNKTKQSCYGVTGSYVLYQDILSSNVSNMLKCNPKKTEIIHFSSPFSPAEPVSSIKNRDCF